MIAPRELLIFLSYDNDEPAAVLAERLREDLGLTPLGLGVDALSGAAELRVCYHPKTVDAVRTYLDRHRLLYDLELLD